MPLYAGLLAVAYFSHPLNPDRRPSDPTAAAENAYSNAKTGIWALVLVFLGYSVVQGPSTAMVRPHPAVWRLVHGIMVCYLLLWIYLLFQTVDDARVFLKVRKKRCLNKISNSNFALFSVPLLVLLFSLTSVLSFVSSTDMYIFFLSSFLLKQHMYPELGVDPGERRYGEDCRLVLPGFKINWPIIKATVFDEFVVAHTLGWWGKALIIRDNVMLWFIR